MNIFYTQYYEIIIITLTLVSSIELHLFEYQQVIFQVMNSIMYQCIILYV